MAVFLLPLQKTLLKLLRRCTSLNMTFSDPDPLDKGDSLRALHTNNPPLSEITVLMTSPSAARTTFWHLLGSHRANNTVSLA
jgi:hypothetical protein